MSVHSYTSSLHYDKRLYKQDIAGSVVHARMLSRQGIISDNDASLIVAGLDSILREIEDGVFTWNPNLEDIHMNIEARLTETIGNLGGKLHTGRSRNDQVVTDLRLYLKEMIQEILACIHNLQTVLVTHASHYEDVILPGYTHLQRAQPVLLAHHLLAYFEMFDRDRDRFRDCLRRTDVLPLGSGALAGVSYPIDREFVKTSLGFASISQNSMDAVSDRDFVVEFQAASALCMTHISRLAEELVMWSSQDFGFVTFDEAFVTGSSMMPQKRNPDLAELARGKTGRVYGHLVSILTVLKGLPLAYNRDLQEDKEGLFDTVDTLKSTLEVLANGLISIRIRADRMRSAVDQTPLLLATDLADYLVSKGVAFREAHGIVSNLCDYLQERGGNLQETTLAEYQRFSQLFGEDVYKITPESSLAARNNVGGTAPKQVSAAIHRAQTRLGEPIG